MSELLNPAQAAKIMGVTQQWVTELLRTGALKGQRVGKLWVVQREEVERYLREKSEDQENQ